MDQRSAQELRRPHHQHSVKLLKGIQCISPYILSSTCGTYHHCYGKKELFRPTQRAHTATRVQTCLATVKLLLILLVHHWGDVGNQHLAHFISIKISIWLTIRVSWTEHFHKPLLQAHASVGLEVLSHHLWGTFALPPEEDTHSRGATPSSTTKLKQ